jgi:hypothetical protein
VIPRLCSAMALSLLVGCAGDPAPNEQMRLTEQAVEQARTLGASENAEAFQLALAKLALAQKNMREADYKRARVLAEQAELDARLAQAQLLRGKSEAQLDTLNGSIERLRRRLGEQP